FTTLFRSSRLNALLTGQLLLASLAHSSNLAWSIFGIFAFNVKWDSVSSSFFISIVMVEVTSKESGVYPAVPRILLKAMAKHPAWAAASSSSGLVPLSSPKRELKLYFVSFNTLLWVVNFPFPSFNEPFQTALAVRFICRYLLFIIVLKIVATRIGGYLHCGNILFRSGNRVGQWHRTVFLVLFRFW